MGMTIEEYLAQREPCEVCDSSGNQDYCVTHMLSRYDNCIFYNAVINTNPSYNNSDVSLMQNLRSSMPGTKVLEYYIRSEPIVKKLKEMHGNSNEFWMTVYNRFVNEIFTLLRSNQNDQAVVKIFSMLDMLEAENP